MFLGDCLCSYLNILIQRVNEYTVINGLNKSKIYTEAYGSPLVPRRKNIYLAVAAYYQAAAT